MPSVRKSALHENKPTCVSPAAPTGDSMSDAGSDARMLGKRGRGHFRNRPSLRPPDSAPFFLYRLFHRVLPAAREEIHHWVQFAEEIPDPTLREQALASLQTKRFHADGGCVYAAGSEEYNDTLVRLIIAYQTISDYLDNLCDRCDTYDMNDFHQLHQAMRDAVRPGVACADYYAFRGTVDDGGYLEALVKTCHRELETLPGYDSIADNLTWLAERYCELQEYKHIEPDKRQSQLTEWWAEYASRYPELAWWEFAAATGSTLGIFALFLEATESMDTATSNKLTTGYFPWICGLHILLDYFIDLEEDKSEGDFNFISCYASLNEAIGRVHHFADVGLKRARQLSFGRGKAIHRFVVLGLLGMYLSDAKVRTIRHLRPIRRLLWHFGPTTWMFYAACGVYRVVR